MNDWYGAKNKKPKADLKKPNNDSIDAEVIVFKLPGKKTVKARKVLVKHSEFANYVRGDLDSSLVHVHRLNPRAQERLDEDALADILPFAETSGIAFPGIAEEHDGKYFLLDSSRRFACARILGLDLPLYVFDKADNLNKEQVKYIAELCRTTRALSYREEGILLLNELTGNNEINDIEAVMEAYRYEPSQKRTVERYIDAAIISSALINLFPDPEGIKNEWYQKLKAWSKTFAKKHGIKASNDESIWNFFKRLNVDIEEHISQSNIQNDISKKLSSLDSEASTKEKQQVVLDAIEGILIGKKEVPQPTWSEPETIMEKSKDNYVKVVRHKNGRDLKIDARRLTKDQEKQIFDLIKSFG